MLDVGAFCSLLDGVSLDFVVGFVVVHVYLFDFFVT